MIIISWDGNLVFRQVPEAQRFTIRGFRDMVTMAIPMVITSAAMKGKHLSNI
jgi:hypothetical protein